MTMFRIKLAALLPLATLAAAGTAAVAAPAYDNARSTQVSYAGLDLTKPAGQAELDRRIARAISQVCDSSTNSPLAMRAEIRKCRAYAWQNAHARRQAVVTAAIEAKGVQVASR